jgi:TonB family protein
MKAIFIFALTCGLLSGAAAADEQLEKSLNDQYRDKTLYLRHSYKSGSQEYDADGQPLKRGEEGTWTLYAGIVVRKIAIGSDTLRVEGNRVAYLIDKNTKRMMPFAKHDSVKIKVRLRAPVTSVDQANSVLGRVFAVTQEDIVNSAPSYWQAFLKEQIAPRTTLVATLNALTGGKQPPSQAETAGFGDAKFFKLGEPGLTPPKILYKQEPDFTEPARNYGVQGVVALNVVVDRTGRVSEVRILHAVGMGLDENAIETVKAWRFDPAKKDGVPVPIAVYIEVDYHLGERR